MSTHQIVGIALLCTGLLDIVLALVVVGPRLPEERRRFVQLALLTGAVLMIALGTAFLSGALRV